MLFRQLRCTDKIVRHILFKIISMIIFHLKMVKQPTNQPNPSDIGNRKSDIGFLSRETFHNSSVSEILYWVPPPNLSSHQYLFSSVS